MERKHTSKRMLGILLTICMVVSLLPMTAITAFAASYPESVRVNNNITLDGSTPYYINGASSASNSSSGYNAYYNSNTGVLTLNGYSGAGIYAYFDTENPVTINLIGNNTVTTGGVIGVEGRCSSGISGTFIVTSENSGKLKIIASSTDDRKTSAIQIDNVVIDGSAQLDLDVSSTGTGSAMGIYAKNTIEIKDSASVKATVSYTGADTYEYAWGSFSNGGSTTINTTGDVFFDVSGSSPTKTEEDYCMRSNSGIQVTNVGTLTCKYLTGNGFAYPGYLTTIDSSLTKTTSVSGNVTTEVWTRGVASLTTIDSVTITGVTEPVAGQASTTAGITTSTTGVSIDSSSAATFWLVLDTATNQWYKFNGTFEAGKTYGIRVLVRPTDSTQYAFADSITATVNGNPATEIAKIGTGGVNREIIYSFGELSEAPTQEIETVNLTLTAPKTGNAPSMATTTDTAYTVANTSWDPEDDPFKANTAYKATINLETTGADKFTENTKFYINGKEATLISPNPIPGYVDEVRIAYTFPKTEGASITLTGTNDPATGKPKLTWEAVPGAANYEIYAYNDMAMVYVLIDTTANTTFTHTSAKVGKNYSYKVKAIPASTSAAPSTSDVVYVTCKYPTPQVTGSNDPATGKPMLTWEKVDGATKYDIYRYKDAAAGYEKIYTTTATSFTNISTAPGKAYWYKVKAVGPASAATSEFSNTVKLTCRYAAPKVTGTNDPATGKPMLTWEKVDGAAKYEIYRYDSATNSYINLITTAGTTFTNTSAKPGYIYYYKVKAIGSVAAAASNFSDKVKLTCKCAAPKVTGTNNPATGKNVLNWEKVTGATKYEIYRYDSASNSYIKLITTTGTTFTNTSAKAGYIYYYKVKAISPVADATSAFCSPVKLTCKYPTPKVTGSNNPATGKNVLNWEKVEGATKYEIYRYDSASNSYIKLITTTGTTFTNTSAKPGYIYYYKVKAIGSVADATSNFSDKVKLTCKCATPKVTGSNTTTGKPKLTWEKVTGATKYEIYRYDSASSSYIKLITTTGTTFTHTSAKPGYIYYYKVKALGATTASDSAMSEKVKVTCK